MNIPALRQSVQSQMACETSYAIMNTDLVQIGGLKPPNTGPSYRGTDCHDILAPYARHCAQRRIPADYAFLDSLLDSATSEVVGIMETCRENLVIDWLNFFAAEISAGLDKDFQPTWSYDHDGNRIEIDPVWGIEGSGKEPAYCVIFDTIYLMPGGTVGRLPDYKTHPRPFAADTFQGKIYSLVLMMFVPELQEVEFGLKFIRYANKTETYKYFRSDVPQMMEDVRRVRNRQRDIHEKVEQQQPLRTHGGSHCMGGETRFLTDRGVRTLRESCGEALRVLDRRGEWVDATVQSFGIQRLMRIIFDDGSVVRATANHRWWKMRKEWKTEGWVQTDERVTTLEVDRAPLAKHSAIPSLDEDGIRHGFIYGDGYKRAHRPSCIVDIFPPKDEHMLRFFLGAKMQKDGKRLRKGGYPGHYKTLEGITSPSYARGFIAGLLAADGAVCKNGGVLLHCEGRQKAEALAEVATFAGCVVASIKMDSRITNFSPTGTTSREMMRIRIKPTTAPILDPVAQLRLHSKGTQMRKMYRKVVRVELDAQEEVFCAVVPGSESFTLANGIITSNCTYCPCVLDPVHIPCPIAKLNPMTNLSPADRLNWRLVHDVMNRTNNQAMQQYVDGSGQEIHSQDANGKHYSFGPVEKEKTTYPLFADDGSGGFTLPIVDALLDWQHAEPADLVPRKGNKPWFLNLRIGSTQLKQYLKAKKREIIDNAIKDLAIVETKVELRITRDASVDDGQGEEYRDFDGEEIEF